MKNILVVDDDISILKFVSDALERQYQVFTAESVAHADKIRQQHDIDLLIADLVMPDKNGIDMIMAFKKAQPEMKILAISGGGGITGRFDYLPIAKLVGAGDTLKKPFSISQLRDAIKILLDS